jgi:hypothetical protein
VESGAASFDVILVYDVSRWGRFQDADESAYYEYLCKRRVRWFYERLYENLQVAHVRVDGPFFTPRGIAAGANWRESLQRALNSSGILVCLQSPLYFDSKVCGQELEAFLQRRKLYISFILRHTTVAIFARDGESFSSAQRAYSRSP